MAAPLVLLAEARAQRPAPRLARAGLWLGICATLAANVEHGAAFGPVGALVNAWPGVAFVVASEILLGMIRRAGSIPARDDTALTVAATTVPVSAAVPAGHAGNVPVIDPVSVPASEVYPTPARRAQTVTSSRAPQRARGRKPKSPARVFASSTERGELPSLREVMRRMNVGQPRAREILRDLQATIDAWEVMAA